MKPKSGSRFKGVFATPITSFDENSRINENAIRRVVKFLYNNEITNLFCLGSWGGFALMDCSERIKTANILIEECKKNDMKIIINVASTSTREAILLAKHAQEQGVDAIASLVPYYYSSNSYNEANYLNYFTSLVNSVNIPVHFYNNPRTTGFALTTVFFKKLLDIGITGMKEGSGDPATFISFMNLLENENVQFDMIPGSVTMFLLGLLYGVSATMVGSAVVFPEIAVRAYKLFNQGRLKEAVGVHSTLMKIRKIQSSKGMGAASCYGILKLRGIDAGLPRSPWINLSYEDLSEIRFKLQTLGLL